MQKDQKIYVAGHKGMVGSAIIRRLTDLGYHRLLTRSHQELDLTNQAKTNAFFEKEMPEIVFLAAAKVGGIVANNTQRAEFIYQNLMIQNNIIHAAWKYNAKKLLFLGSSCIYPKHAPQPLKEEYLLSGPLEFTNEPYAIAKIAGIKLCESYYRQFGCNFISVMPTNLYGPNDNYNLETSHVLPALIRKMHLGKCLGQNDWANIRADLHKNPIGNIDGDSSQEEILKCFQPLGITVSNQNKQYPGVSISLWGTGKVYREFLHVDDMADACVYLMEHIDAPRLYHELKQTHINIGTGIDLTIKELSSMVKAITRFKGKILWDTTKPDGTPKKQLDISLIQSLKWNPKLDLDKGIKQVYASYLASS